MENFHKIDLAEKQLETALDLYFSGGDLVSVVTLAGAAEEILGVCLKINGIPNSLDELVNATCVIHERFFVESLPKKDVFNRANQAKNNFKHLNNEDDLEISLDLPEEARDMLDRAITNYWRFKGDLTKSMVAFQKQQGGV